MKTTFKLLAIAFLISVMICAAIYSYAQNVVRDKEGNYTAIHKAKDSTQATNTGKMYTDTNGNKYPVYVSKNDKLFVIRKSAKTGNEYKQYLKVN